MIKLVKGSCLDILPTIEGNSVDLTLTDPPYQISRETNFLSGNLTGRDTDRFRVSMNFGTWDTSEGLDIVISEIYRVLKPGGTLICFYDLWKMETLKRYLETAKFKQLRFIEWVKTNPVPLNSKTNYLTNAREIAISAVKKGKPTFHSQYDKGIYEFPICHDKSRFHPTQKPVELMEALIAKHSNPGDTVLDPFMGSGSVGIAARNLDRNFIGIEISQEYYNKTRTRFFGEERENEKNDDQRKDIGGC